MNWLFRNFDPRALGLFRIFFYSAFFFYFSFVSMNNYEMWFTEQMQSFYEPISLFKWFDYSFLKSLIAIKPVTIWKWSMLFCVVGFLYPLSSMVAFLSLLLIVGIPLNFGKIHHLNHLPVVVFCIMAFSFSAGSFSVDNVLSRKVWRRNLHCTFWPLQAARIYMCLIYCFSGLQKLRITGLDWIFSDNMQNIILTRPTVTDLGLWVATMPTLCKFVALTTVIAQVFAPLALIRGPQIYFLIPTLFCLHIGTLLVLGMHGYFVPYNLCFLVWLPWEKIATFILKRTEELKFKLA